MRRRKHYMLGNTLPHRTYITPSSARERRDFIDRARSVAGPELDEPMYIDLTGTTELERIEWHTDRAEQHSLRDRPARTICRFPTSVLNYQKLSAAEDVVHDTGRSTSGEFLSHGSSP